AEAAADTRALQVEGREASGLGGLLKDGVVYAQVRALAAAFGGVTALIDPATVAVFFERAVLREVSQPELPGDEERIVLTFSRDTPVERQGDFDTVRFRFLRAGLGMSAQWLQGKLFSDGALYAGPNYVELRLTLHEGVDFDLLELPQGQGVQVVIDVFKVVAAAEGSLRVVLDPAPTSLAQDDGLFSLARRLQNSLARRGWQVEVTRDGGVMTPLENRANRGIGADLFLSFGVAPLAEGHLNLFYLADADNVDSLQLAIRHNAQTSVADNGDGTENGDPENGDPENGDPENGDPGNTAALRRRLLLGLAPDLAFGEHAANRLASVLGEAGYEPDEVVGLPLYVLGGAAGRGVFIEVSPSDLRDPEKQGELADLLATGLDALLAR
ncbi:MAG: hypothetical protein M3511_11770, partial [Deinococcota bacterium]|nr:hypothetical protein [Deinococcota bacterium]